MVREPPNAGLAVPRPPVRGRRARAATALALILLVTGSGAGRAQEMGARGPASAGAMRATLSGASPGVPAAQAGDDAGLDLRHSLSGRAPAKRPPPQRRFRSATARDTRPPLRLGTAPRLFPVVQTPVTGLPDVPEPAPLKKRRLEPEDSYAPPGIRLGNVLFFPALQQGVGYDTNPDRVSPGRRSSAALRTDGELAFRSDWSNHQLEGSLRGGYFDYPDNKAANRPDGAGAVRLRLDADRDLKLDTEVHYSLDTQRPGSPDLNAAVRSRPIVATYGGFAGVTDNFNRFQIRLQASVDRQEFENATLANGTLLRQDDRNANQYGLRLRTGYELTPGLMPFVDTLIDTRVHDFTLDSAGYRRDSDGIAVKAGTTFEISRLLTGEISAGLLHRSYVDTRLRDLDGPVVDASLIWAATPLTTVRLRAQTDVTETDIVGASGILTQRGTLEVQHDLRRNLRLILAGSLYTNQYKGAAITENGATGSVKLDYRLTRWLALRASYTHETLHSTVVGSSYTSNTYLVGLRLNP